MGWCDVHKDLQELPYCEKHGQITKVFKCLKCNTCKATGQCVAYYENGFENHYLVAREEIAEFEEEKRFVRIWGQPKLISESKEEKKKREEVLWLLSVQRTIERLSKEYLEQKAVKKIRKKGGTRFTEK